MGEALAAGERRLRQPGNSPAAVDTGLRLIGKLLDCGDVEGASCFMGAIGPGLGRDADQHQSLALAALRVRIAEMSEREAAAGGPGSLFDAEHPFAIGMREAGERARQICFE